jgi:hypothetical protein
MTNIVEFNPAAKVPTFAKRESALTKSLAGGGGMGGKRISIKGGVFRLFADGKEVAAIPDRHLDVVIVNAAATIARTFYAGTFVEGQTTAPACWSPDGVKPAPEVAEPQSDICASCPQNVKGSGQGDTRACRFSQRLAVVLANDVRGDVLQLQVPATSLFGKEEGGNNRPLQAYARWLAAQSVNPGAVVTRLSFDLKATAPKMFFNATRWLTDAEFETCEAQGQSDEAKQAVTLTVSQTDKVEAPAPMALPGKPPAKAKAKPAPVEEPEAEAPAQAPEAEAEEKPEEPVKRKEAAKATAPKRAADLSSVISNWDADDE